MNPRTNQGQTAIEFALIFPIFLTLLGIGVDYGSMINQKDKAENASREAARLASQSTTDTGLLDAAKARAQRALSDSGIPWWDATFRTQWRIIPVNESTDRWYVDSNVDMTAKSFFGSLFGAGDIPISAWSTGYYDDKPRGLAGQWNMDNEGIEAVVKDTSGNKNDGVNRGARFTDGERGMRFDGHSLVLVPYDPVLDIGGPGTDGATVSLDFMADANPDLWKRQDWGEKLAFFRKHQNTASDGYYSIRLYHGSKNNDYCKIVVQVGGWNGVDTITSQTKIYPNQWNNVTFTFDGVTDGKIKLYINGILDSSMTETKNVDYGPDWTHSRYGLALGGYEGMEKFDTGECCIQWRTTGFVGQMDNVALYNTKLSDQQVQDLVNSSVA